MFPSLLPPGTRVDGWTVVAHHGQGSYGDVYKAVRTGHEQEGPVALKLARYPWDPRFAREGEVLSRLHHPSVPRLLGRGLWRPAPDVEHPYLVLEWIDGTRLYKWARQHAPTPEQVLLLLSQVAQALAATHSLQAVHRDVKGDNILVRHSDGRAMLIDFGSAHYEGASRLTWQHPPPGTSAYYSPEALLFVIRSARSPFARFQATPADDLFALGVTAYCLVMGEYPPRPEPVEAMDGTWQWRPPELRPLLERSPRVEPRLRECILRLLSMEPAARGTAAELARSLNPLTRDAEEALAPRPDTAPQPAPVLADAPSPEAEPPSGAVVPLEDALPQRPVRTWRFWLALATMGLAWFLEWSLRPVHSEPERILAGSHAAPARQGPDADLAAVGDSADKDTGTSAHGSAKQEAIAQDPLPKPQPRQQTQPDGQGRCPGPRQVPLNGLCWLEQSGLSGEECEKHGYLYMKGQCYAPVFTPHGKRQPTSDPPGTQ
jgi:serine/threonine protein kinase